ncbi:MAG: EamA family transporter [Alphaproteobacteria bacterium]|nr:EamA family transporter [Alphaproteobacteria bacterium]
MTAVLLGLASAAFLGAGLVLTQFGLRTVHPLSGAAISVPSFTIVFLLLSPLLLHGQSIEWRAVPIFAAVGLVFPAALTMLTFASNRALGPVVTGALGNLSPLLSVGVAVLLLHEPLRSLQFAGLVVSVVGVFTITVTRTDDMRDWRTWALLLPLGASVVRGVIPPVIKVGLEVWPNAIAAGLTGYIFSTLTVLTVERIRTGRFLVNAPWSGKLWFALNGICNGTGTLLLYAALGAGPVSLVAPLYATYPLFTVGMSVLFLGNVKVTFRLVAGTALTVGGVVLVLLG